MSKISTPDADLEPIRLPRFDWDHAKNFYYVAKLGSFTRAAQFLKVSQPSLSRKIIDLEADLRCKLLHRTPRGVSVTRKGEELFQIIEQTFVSLKGFGFNAMAMANGGQKRKIRISTTYAIASNILDTHLLAYNKENPHLIFELATDDHLIDIIVNDVDIAIRPFNPEARGIQQELLFSLEKRLFASQDYLDQYGEPQTVEELKNHRIIGPVHPEELLYVDAKWILKLGLPEGQFHEPVFRSTPIESSIKAARLGLGIVGSYEEMESIKNSRLINILPKIKDKKVDCYFTYPNHFANDKEITKLKNYLFYCFNPD